MNKGSVIYNNYGKQMILEEPKNETKYQRDSIVKMELNRITGRLKFFKSKGPTKYEWQTVEKEVFSYKAPEFKNKIQNESKLIDNIQFINNNFKKTNQLPLYPCIHFYYGNKKYDFKLIVKE